MIYISPSHHLRKIGQVLTSWNSFSCFILSTHDITMRVGCSAKLLEIPRDVLRCGKKIGGVEMEVTIS